MPKDRPRPTSDQIRWFKQINKQITKLEQEIKSGDKSGSLFDQTLNQINHRQYKDPIDANLDLVKIKDARDRQRLDTDRVKSLIKSLKRVRDLVGICSQCGGTGYHEINFGRRRPLLNEPPKTCNHCWGSGWQKGNKNPFAVPGTTKRSDKKT